MSAGPEPIPIVEDDQQLYDWGIENRYTKGGIRTLDLRIMVQVICQCATGAEPGKQNEVKL